MKYFDKNLFSDESKTKFIHDGEADISEDLLSERVEVQTPKLIENLSQNMKQNPFWKPKLNLMNTVKKADSEFKSLSPIKKVRSSKTDRFIIEQAWENHFTDNASLKLSLKEDISRLLKQAVIQRTKSPLIRSKQASVSMKTSKDQLQKDLVENSNFNHYLITVREVEGIENQD